MLNTKFASMIRDDVKIVHLFLFVFVMSIIGIIINYFEKYPFFYILLPVLIIMFFSTTMILKIGLEKLQKFKKDCGRYLKKDLNILYSQKQSMVLLTFFLMMVLIYFICLYQLGYYAINLMGLYILFLGGGTFLIALISYEMYVKILLLLYQLAQNKKLCQQITQIKDFQKPLWFQYLFQLSKTLRNASLFIGIIFVFENAMIYISNYNILLKKYVEQNDTNFWWKKFVAMPLEFWMIWIFVFVSIGIAFPIMAYIQTKCIKKIVAHIEESLKKEIWEFEFKNIVKTLPCVLYVRLLTMKHIDEMLEKDYFPQRADKFIAIIASLLTSIIHITSLYALFFTK